MLKQEPLPTHDGRAGNKGAIVNIASQLGIVSTYSAREYFERRSHPRQGDEPETDFEQLRIVRLKRLLSP
jgi:hypothetical protein